ncbi:primosomal protein N' [Oscillatoria sp. FACHB-1407]|uniref:primosomal protein N' n=1 Tax=Oscillatoria sp. FACHB-1407 TaxID=2692847 RepID=UPI001689D8F6|nr:primosomal protein N' [Oscillatoria sp. FACHB-1407]
MPEVLSSEMLSVAEGGDRSPRGSWVETLVDCAGAQGLYTYRVPADIEVQPGDILSVPFGAQQVGAIAIRRVEALPEDLPPSAVRDVEEVICQGFFPSSYWSLLQQTATYYCTPLIQVVRTALPPGLLGRSQRRIRLTPTCPNSAPADLSTAAQQILEQLQSHKTGDYAWQYLQRQVNGASRGLRELLQRGWVESYLEPPTPVKPKQRQAVTFVAEPAVALSPRQHEVLEVLKRRGGEMWLQDLLQTCQTSSAVLKGLQQKGCVVVYQREVLRTESGASILGSHPKALTSAQQAALVKIQSLDRYQVVLLHGVTGSGKTEVYLQAIAPILNQGKSALVLVPEIGLTPQLTDRFRARFGSKVMVYHSALSEGERYDTWRQMLSGTPQVVIGTRSAIFAPLPNLGLIVLDEEHDSSFKQDQPTPCYHARTVAHWRAASENCPLILGSATPSIETWVEVQGGFVGHISASDTHPPTVTPFPEKSKPLYLALPERVHARPLPPIDIIDMRQELLEGNRSMFSRALQTALHTLQDQQQQGILFVPRRGHSTFVSCRSCGFVLGCPHCDISLTYHQPHAESAAFLRCHYCNFRQAHPDRCPSCESPYLKHFGSGTQRVIQEITQQFPTLRCLRFDSDTTRTKGAHRALLDRFARGEADVLVGTQMLTKGIDLPQVTLVGVVAADGMLHLPDYRASERTFQVLTQVAGRAGRGSQPGRVLLQTYSPQHPVVQAVQRYDYDSFIETEQQQRTALGYPPFGHLVLLRLSGVDPALVRRIAERLGEKLRFNQTQLGYDLLGPAPAAIERVARRYRWQILLKYRTAQLQGLPNLQSLRQQCPSEVSLTIDVDPLNLL